jgi:hypothetical protein
MPGVEIFSPATDLVGHGLRPDLPDRGVIKAEALLCDGTKAYPDLAEITTASAP